MSLMLKALTDGVGRVFSMPRLSLPLIATLGLTLGAVLCLVAMVSALVFKPIPGLNSSQNLKRLEFTMYFNDTLKNSQMSMRRIANLQQYFGDYGQWAGLNVGEGQVNINGTDFGVTNYGSSDNILQVLGTRLIKGEALLNNNAEGKVWISQSLWQQGFLGREDIVGQTLTFKDKDFLVAGVIEDLYGMSNKPKILPQQIWQVSNLAMLKGKPEPNSDPTEMAHLFLQPKGTEMPSKEEFMQWLEQYVRAYAEQPDGLWGFYQQLKHTLTTSDFRTHMLGSSKDLLIGLFIAVICLLLIAILNLLNLFIAFYQERTREFALRISLGAPLNQVRALVFLENLATFVFAGCLGLLVAGWLIRSLPELADGQLPMLSLIKIDFTTVLVSLVAVILLNGLFSLFALIDINKPAIAQNLGSSGKGSFAQQNQWLKRALMTFQLTLACIVLTAAAMVAKSNYEEVYRDIGFTIDDTYQVSMDFADSQWQEDMSKAKVSPDNEYHRLLAKLSDIVEQQVPGSNVVVPSYGPLADVFSIYAFSSQGDSGNMTAFYQVRNFSQEYFDTFDIQLIAGSNLTQAQINDHEHAVVIDQQMADTLFPGKSYESLIGEGLPIAAEPYRIAGIVKNLSSMAAFDTSIVAPTVYRSFYTVGSKVYMTVKMPSSESLKAEQFSEAILRAEPRLKNVEVTSYQDMLARQTLRSRINLWIVLTLTGLTLFLAAIGVAGMTRMTTNHKKYELAIRMATGAKQSTLVQVILKDAFWMLAIGLGLGFLISTMGYTQMQNQLSMLPPFDWWIMAAADTGLIAIVLLSVIIPAWRVIRDEPMAVLREE